jgi:hypothetical protein
MKKTKRREFLKTAGVAAIGASCMAAGAKDHAQEEPEMANKKKEFQPGEKVRTSGIYDVLHDKIDGEHHAEQHQVIVIAGTVFPRCKGCHEWVRFRLSQAALYIAKDPHFET